jgi:hypothetical protein
VLEKLRDLEMSASVLCAQPIDAPLRQSLSLDMDVLPGLLLIDILPLQDECYRVFCSLVPSSEVVSSRIGCKRVALKTVASLDPYSVFQEVVIEVTTAAEGF